MNCFKKFQLSHILHDAILLCIYLFKGFKWKPKQAKLEIQVKNETEVNFSVWFEVPFQLLFDIYDDEREII